MKTSKLLLVSVFFFFFPLMMTILSMGCRNNSNNCTTSPAKKYYDVKSMESIVINTNDNKPYTTTQILSYDKILIGIQVKDIEFVAVNPKNSLENSSNGLLMACDPLPEGFSGSKEWIKGIKITSNNAFSIDFPAGADLAKKFWLYEYSYFLPSSLISIAMATPQTNFEYYKNAISITPVDEINKMRTNTQYTKAFRALGVNDSPTASKSHIFTIEYEHQGGEKFTFITQIINFL